MESLKQLLKKKGYRLQINMTGGGIQFLSELTRDGGISSFFMGANFPYDCETQAAYFDKPRKYVSAEYASTLTKRVGNENLTLGITAQLSKPNEREGRFNGAYLSLYNHDKHESWNKKIELAPGERFSQEMQLSLEIETFLVDCLSFINNY